MEFKVWHQRIIALLLIAYFLLGYLPINAFNFSRDFYYTLALPGEEKIPFLPHFIVGYLFVYLSVFLIYGVIPNWNVFKKMAWGFFILTTIHFVVFLLFPVKMVFRPSILQINTPIDWIVRQVFSLDHPYNCFPSLHVAYPTLTATLSWRFIRRYRFLFGLMALLTAFSVVFVKQHYILDAVAGGGIAILIGVLIPR